MRTRHKTTVPGIYYREDSQGTRRYIVWYRSLDGKERTETLPPGSTLVDAKTRKAQLQVRRSVIPTKQTVAELLNEWLERRRDSVSFGTMLIYTWAVRRLEQDIGATKVVNVTPDHIVGLRQTWVRAGYMKHSISKLETPLRGVLKTAARNGLIEANPFDKLFAHESVKADQRKMRCMDSDEIDKLLQASGEDRTMFFTLISTGLRIGELRALVWDDVDLVNGAIHVRKSKTKAGERAVMLFPALIRLLSALKLQSEPGVELVFPFPYTTIHHRFRRATRAAGIPDYTIHECRHTYASILISNPENELTWIAKQLGHASPDITLKVYAHLWETRKTTDEARERLQAAFGGMA